MKIGLWLQDHRNDTIKRFNEVMEIVKKSDIDLLVFPEDAYIPFNRLLDNDDCVFEGPGKWFKEADKLAKKIGKPVMFSSGQTVSIENMDDDLDIIFSYYTNPAAAEGETINRIYFKNTMTGISPLEFENYEDSIIDGWNQFAPIDLKGKQIGMTICYDCTFPIFSAMYGAQSVDILINMTGGNVDYHKWYRYNQVRAIENLCFSFVTMGYYEDKTVNSYVYGFDPDGKRMTFTNLMDPSTDRCNEVDSIYVYDTEEYETLDNLQQSELSENTHQDLMIEAGKVSELIAKAKKLTDHLYVLKKEEHNIVFALCNDERIYAPELVASILYDDMLKDIPDKRYILVNKCDTEVHDNLINQQLDALLRVRAMENFCAVVYESPNDNRCYQYTKFKESQRIKEVNGKFGIDLSRTTGPEAVWNKDKGRAIVNRRNTYERLIEICNDWMIMNIGDLDEI